MIHVESFEEILEILLQNVADEGCGHASYVSNEDDITELIRVVNASSDAVIDLINFDNCSEGYYVFELDYDGDDYLSYSIWPAHDEDGLFYTNYGLCLVDECVPDEFEEDYDEYGSHDKDYIKPIRIKKFLDDEPDCENCDVEDCPHNKPAIRTTESTKIDTDDDGSLTGFTKTWKNDHSYFSYTYHSTNEDDVLDLMNRFNIEKPE